jgi:outer membrane protein assembly factor BamB
MKRLIALLLLPLLLPTFGCRLLVRLPEEITDPRIRELHGLGPIPEEETWWQTRDRRLEEQEKLLFNFPLRQRWAQAFDDGGAISGAPVVEGRDVYLTVPGEGLARLNEEDGIPIWLLEPRPGEVYGPLAVEGGLLIFGTSTGRLLAVDPVQPRTAWELNLEAGPLLAPVVGGGTVYCCSVSGTLFALSAEDGALRWRQDVGGPMAAAPGLDPEGGRLFTATQDGTVACIDLDNGVLRWRYASGTSHHVTPLMAGRRLFVGGDDGGFRCLDAETGRLRWTKSTGAAVRTTAFAVDDLVIFGSWDGLLYAVEQSGGRTRWKAELPGRMVLPPVGLDELVVVACLRSPELSAYRLEDGRPSGAFKLEHLDAWFTSPPYRSTDGMLFAGTSRGKLVAMAEIIEEEMSEEEASRARFEDLLSGRRADDGSEEPPPPPQQGAQPSGGASQKQIRR